MWFQFQVEKKEKIEGIIPDLKDNIILCFSKLIFINERRLLLKLEIALFNLD